MHGNLKNQHFLNTLKEYISKHYKDLQILELNVCIDMFKFMVHLEDDKLNNKLNDQRDRL
jgi:hypothetical protein